jgi:hypothetical protein
MVKRVGPSLGFVSFVGEIDSDDGVEEAEE